jgi:hypothetical protein
MERAVLGATELGLCTCWLGGTFSKSRFARTVSLAAHELVPAVAAVGYGKQGRHLRDGIRRAAGSATRLPAEALFFEGGFGQPISAAAAGAWAEALEMVRWAPSASNRQPWRIVRTGAGWHFFLARTRGYGKGTLIYALLGIADLQRVDLGIAMTHFELTARERGLAGDWVRADPGIAVPDERTTYVATWRPAG